MWLTVTFYVIVLCLVVLTLIMLKEHAGLERVRRGGSVDRVGEVTFGGSSLAIAIIWVLLGIGSIVVHGFSELHILFAVAALVCLYVSVKNLLRAVAD